MSGWPEAEVRLVAADGWPVAGILRAPDAGSAIGGVVLVPGSKHERDAYGTLPAALEAVEVVSLRIDIRGRGASLGSVPHARMGPRQRRAVGLDVAVAVGHLAGLAGAGAAALALVAEQDTAADAVEAVSADDRLSAIVLLSPRHGARLVAALALRPVAVFGLVSREDPPGLRATADAYLASAEGPSRFELFRGLGQGTTMMSARQFEEPGAESIEAMVAAWLAARLGG